MPNLTLSRLAPVPLLLPALPAALLVCLLAACSTRSGPLPLPPPDSHEVDSWVMHGYLSDTRRPIEHRSERVALTGEAVAVEWTVPSQGRDLPLVVYLPGLGESLRDGVRWRDAWAAAGYAVLAIAGDAADRPPAELLRRVDKPEDGSPPPADAQALRQRLADQRDARREWTRQRFTPEVAALRVQRLAATLAALQADAAGHAALLQRIELQHAVLAGYDVGAYTALLAVGELPRAGWAVPALPVAVQAVIALSPYADFGGTAFAQRYQRIRVPVLSVSGAGDVDGAGLVPSAYVRRAPFENLPGHASLLWLRSGSHAVLAGRIDRPGGDGAEASSDSAGVRDAAGRSSGRNPATGDSSDDSEAGRARLATEHAVDAVIVAATTTAFLDAELKQDGVARRWLSDEAARWIRPRGEWHQR